LEATASVNLRLSVLPPLQLPPATEAPSPKRVPPFMRMSATLLMNNSVTPFRSNNVARYKGNSAQQSMNSNVQLLTSVSVAQ